MYQYALHSQALLQVNMGIWTPQNIKHIKGLKHGNALLWDRWKMLNVDCSFAAN